MTQATINFETATGHQVMAAAGKKILHPGDKAATEQLFQWAEFKPGETVLELAASFGYSAMALQNATECELWEWRKILQVLPVLVPIFKRLGWKTKSR
ncbi:MAG: hypothetical protein ACAF41_04210 [Leptolyngbya sp. BL-A-14]